MTLKVKRNRPEVDSCFSLILEKPTGFSFYPGQYLDVELPVKDKNGNTRAFTISSSPTEDFLMITTKKGVSVFKKYLENLRSEDIITTSHPAGTFTLDEKTAAVFIAGGIGITPFRSIIKYVFDKKIPTPITLIYSASDDSISAGKNLFIFKDQLDQWQKQLPNLKLNYLDTNKEGRLDRQKLLKALENGEIIYYLAGPPAMVDNLENILLKGGIDQTNIRTDRFDGY